MDGSFGLPDETPIHVSVLQNARQDMGDAPLLEDAKQGDSAAFTTLLEQYRDRVFANCYRVLGEASEAEDAAQESFSRLWKAIGGGKAPDRDAAGWLMRVSRNLCIDRLRRRARWTTDEGALETQEDTSPNAEALRQTQDVGKRVQAALDALPDRQRAAIALVHYEGLPQATAAEELDVSVDALESLLARARRKLREQLAQDKADLL